MTVGPFGPEWEKFNRKKKSHRRREPELVDGIKFSQTRTIRAPNEDPLFNITLGKAGKLIEDYEPNAIFHVLAEYYQDGTVRQLIIDFHPPFLTHQRED